MPEKRDDATGPEPASGESRVATAGSSPSRERLAALKEMAATAASPGTGNDGEVSDEDLALRAFLDDIAEKKNQRRTQLGLVEAFFSDPLRFSSGLDDEVDTDDNDELARRRVLLDDQIVLLTTILEAANAELEQVDKALARTDEPQPDAS